jgi:hypothetical protein
MFKKLVLWLGIAGMLWAGSFAMVNAQNFDNWWFGGSQDAEIDWVSTNTMTEGWLVGVIKSFINWVLGILSLIALVIVLFWWFKMVTAAGDETKYKEGFKILQQAAIWLAVIWLSWFIVSIIFWLIGGSSGWAVWAGWAV